jgi:Holliday junction resolvase
MRRKAPLERTIVAKVMAQGRASGFWVTKFHGNAYSMSGVPDVLMVKDGRAVWLECKRPGEEPTKIQLHRMRELSEAGCPVAVVTSAAEAKAFLESVA